MISENEYSIQTATIQAPPRFASVANILLIALVAVVSFFAGRAFHRIETPKPPFEVVEAAGVLCVVTAGGVDCDWNYARVRDKAQ